MLPFDPATCPTESDELASEMEKAAKRVLLDDGELHSLVYRHALWLHLFVLGL